MPSIVALIPARSGSKRVPGKNFKLLQGQPLVNYTIDAACDSGIFSHVFLVADWEDIDPTPAFKAWNDGLPWETKRHEIGRIRRSAESATDAAPDILWVREALDKCWFGAPASQPDAFAILRPTSPFRTAETIKRAWAQFKDSDVDSIRAIERWFGPHPGKMWYYDPVTLALNPVVREWTAEAPYHSSPTQELVDVYRQNASLEMAWTRVVKETNTISGEIIGAFFTEGHEGFDINTEDDWKEAERLMAHQPVEYLG